MSNSSNPSLGSIRQQAQFRSNLENNPSVSTQEWNGYATSSYKRLYNMLTAAYGNNYSVATTYQFSITQSQFYPFPDGTAAFTDSNGNQAQKFWKLLGVDLQYSASPTGWITLKRAEFIERNRYGYPNSAINFNGYTNLRYNIVDSNLFFMPVPMAGQQARIWYIPAPTNLQFSLQTTLSVGSASYFVSDTTGLQNGMNVAASQGIPANTQINSINSTSGLVTLTNAATINSGQVVSMWNDSTTFDGISGWEEYVIVDMAIKAKVKREEDITELLEEKQEMQAEIEALAEARDAGQAFHVSDALSINGWGFDGLGGGWFGEDGGWP